MSADSVPPPNSGPVPAAITDRPSRWRRLAPVLALLVLAPWTAECVWGGFTAADFLVVVVFLGPLYGGAAVLIREVARRRGAGWPAIVLLAGAFGMFQAGLVDQGLFNLDYLADTQYAEQATESRKTLVPGLEFSAYDAVSYVGNHILLSICAPIALVESFVGPRRRLTPWLGGRGLVVIGVVYLLGSLLVFSDSEGRKNFMASPVQVAFAAAVVLAFVAAALLPRWRRPAPCVPAAAPWPVWPGLAVAVAYVTTGAVPGWAGVGLHVGIIAVVAALVVIWSRRCGWGQRHVLGTLSGGVLSAAAVAYAVPTYEPSSPTEALVGDIAISVIALALVGGAFWRLHRTGAEAAAQQTHAPDAPVRETQAPDTPAPSAATPDAPDAG